LHEAYETSHYLVIDSFITNVGVSLSHSPLVPFARNSFTARRFASAVIAMALCLCQCLCLSLVGVLSKRMNGLSWFLTRGVLRPILRYNGIQISTTMRTSTICAYFSAFIQAVRTGLPVPTRVRTELPAERHLLGRECGITASPALRVIGQSHRAGDATYNNGRPRLRRRRSNQSINQVFIVVA